MHLSLVRHDQRATHQHLVRVVWVAVDNDPHAVLLAPPSMERHQVRALGTQVRGRLLLRDMCADHDVSLIGPSPGSDGAH